MITQNTDKKTLVDKLVAEKLINAEQAYLLLDEPEHSIATYPQYPLLYPLLYPYYPSGYWEWKNPYPYTEFAHGTILCNDTVTINAPGFIGTVNYCLSN